MAVSSPSKGDELCESNLEVAVYDPMLSNFQVTVSVCVPARFTVGFAPSVNTRPVVEQSVVSALHVATELKAAALRLPEAPVPFDQLAAFHVTSEADQVVPEPPGAVNEAAFAWSDTRSCLVADASTIWSIVTAAADALVALATSLTVKTTVAGTITRACSLTVAENVVL